MGERLGPCLCWPTTAFQCLALNSCLLNVVVRKWVNFVPGLWDKGLPRTTKPMSVSFLFSKSHSLLFPEASVLGWGYVLQSCGFFSSFSPLRRQDLFQTWEEVEEINTVSADSGIFFLKKAWMSETA